GRITEPPNQDGLNINPVWSPDGAAVAFISDRTGAPQIFMYELSTQAYSQVTNLISGVSAITEYSPAISWSRATDRLAFTYYENGDYSIWSIDNPRSLRKNLNTVRQANASAEASAVKVADAKTAAADTLTAPEKTGVQSSTYRAPAGARRSSDVPAVEKTVEGGVTNIAELLANPTFGLPDTARFKEYKYKVAFRPDYISQPQIGYATGNQYGLSGFQGGTTIVLGDLLSNHQIAISASVYGQLSDASVLAAYTNLSRRFQYTVGAYQEPVFLPQSSQYETQQLPNGGIRYIIPYTRYVLRTGFTTGLYPLNRFTRFETGVQFNNIDRSSVALIQDCYSNGCTGQSLQTVSKEPAYNFFAPQVAFVTDNTLATSMGPISGRRARFQVSPAVGNLKWIDYLGDYRQYFPIRFNSLTFAVRGLFNAAVGRDEGVFPKYIGRPEYVRGYDRANFSGYECTSTIGSSASCNTVQLVGSRVAVGNAELRFPLIRRFDLGSLPIGLPPVDAVIFYDAGLAWSKGQTVSLSRPADYNFETMRYPLTSYGFGLRVNLFNIAILRWDFAVPRDVTGRKANWTFSLGPSF
nr:PD40 domain-containing protein [Gemmatimonadaceae bacterium]